MTSSINGLGRPAHSTSDIISHRKLFDSLDKNQDKSLDKKEFTDFTASLGFDGSSLFDQLDKEHTGKIDFNSFVKALPGILATMFKGLDQNSDGNIDSKEIEKFAKAFGFDPQKLLRSLDSNRDGKIGMDEFVKNFGKVLDNPGAFMIKGDGKTAPSDVPRTPKQIQNELIAEARGETGGTSSILDSLNPGGTNKIDMFW